MTGCNASIALAEGTRMRCQGDKPPPHSRHYGWGGDKIEVSWKDNAPGASPHAEPDPVLKGALDTIERLTIERNKALNRNEFLNASCTRWQAEAEGFRAALEKIAKIAEHPDDDAYDCLRWAGRQAHEALEADR